MAEHVYVVQRINWQWNDEWYYPEDDTPLKAFRRREDAEKYQQVLENEARTKLVNTPQYSGGWFSQVKRNPWNQELDHTFGVFENLTTLSLAEFEEKAHALGFRKFRKPIKRSNQLPDHGHVPEWWWGHVWSTLKPTNWEPFWMLLNKIVFFEVVEVEIP